MITAVLWLSFFLVVIGLIIYTVSLLMVGRDTFAMRFTQETGMDYNAVIQEAVNNGYPASFTLIATLLGHTFTYINFLGYNFSIYLSGEIKEVQKSQFIAITALIALAGLITQLGRKKRKTYRGTS